MKETKGKPKKTKPAKANASQPSVKILQVGVQKPR
jgi:hypothetical protein